LELRIKEVVEILEGELLEGDPERRITGVSTDSRTLKAGELFFALKGKRFDGHDFIEEAKEKGASGAVIEREVGNRGFPLIKVKDTLYALGKLASFWRDRLKGTVIGITGSCGKTTTKEMMGRLFSLGGFKVSQSPNSYNNQIGLPLSLLRASEEDEVIVLEMGMSFFGEISYLSRIARPHVGIITNIGPAHLEGVSDLRGVQRAKAELLEGMNSDSILIYNEDDPLVREIAENFHGKKVSFGKSLQSTIRAEDIKFTEKGVEFLLKTPSGGIKVSSKVLGEGGVYCSLAASSAAIVMGIPLKKIGEGLSSFEPLPLRGCVVKLKDFWIIEDCYNSNPMSLRSALNALSSLSGRKIAVLGDMAELGVWAEVYHKEVGRWCAQLGIDALFLLGKWAESIASGALEEGFKGFLLIGKDHVEIGRALKEYVKKGDFVLLKGSRIMEMERIKDFLEEE
jgi:UDP-N-acetylmuramoyl-tripeptide--D-alanyl-D-alanine ligase